MATHSATGFFLITSVSIVGFLYSALLREFNGRGAEDWHAI
jgi:hypothetical protein